MNGRLPKRVLGVDPGQKGAMAFLSVQGEIEELEDMPVIGKEVNAHMVSFLIQGYGPILVAVVEAAHSMPREGHAGAFTYGTGYGKVLGVLAALDVPIELASASTWKKAMGLTTDKDLSRSKATSRWPTYADSFKLKKHDGRAEAALLAMWWINQHRTPRMIKRRLVTD
jgi:crossover junction endodeoxyribonuclease RuvC